MATWTIRVNAQSGQGDGASGTHATTLQQALPGDFDGATINSVTLSSPPITIVTGASDDTVGVRINIETSTGTEIYGSASSDAAALAVAAPSTSGSAILKGSSVSPAPTTAVAADWDNVQWTVVYNRSGKADGATIAWSQFDIVVDYTPVTPPVPVNQATETDTAQPITLETRRLVTQATETDLAQAITAVLGPRVWLNTAANGATLTGATQMTVTAWSLDGTSVTFSDPVGAPIGTGLWLGVENGSRGEANTGWIQVTVTASGFQVTVNQATETDTAQPITAELRRLVTQATETDTAQPIGTAKTKTAVQATETDTSQPITSAKTRAIGQSTETDTAQPVSTAKSRTAAQASETDTAQPITSAKTKTIGQASETDTAQPITYDFRRLLSQATETDQAFSISPPGAINVPLNQATETDTAQPITVDPQRRLVSPASETDTAQPITALQSKIIAVGQATETDTAQPVTLETRRLVTLATETDAAQPITVLKTRAIAQATETDTAQPIIQPVGQIIAVGQASETDTAQPITVLLRRLVGLATESDSALPITVIGGAVTAQQGGGSGGHGAVVLPTRPRDELPEAPPELFVDEILAALAVIELDQRDYD